MGHDVKMIAFGLSLVLGVGVAAAQDPEGDRITEALTVFNHAKFLHQEKRYDEAIREYREAIKLDKENPFVFNALGLALAARRQLKEAIEAFEQALKLSPALTDVYNNMGVVYAEMGRREQAFEAFGRVVRDPTYPTPEKALFNLGELYLRDKNYELALMHYKRAVEKKPDFVIGYRGIGLALLGLGDQAQARAQFEKAIELAPDEAGSLYELARLHEQHGETEKALSYYRRVVEADRFSALGRLSLMRLDALKPPSQ